ncbi:hypothetical protein BTURN675_488 [Blochmannia endosymbiont of Polyrhachis (Hedomyrma) turneri]|nr:hypothetical protein BTURN675_488 [Blochmannia endosymbiont of Polyrhachis (Hedomyrma) turneri]
MCNIKKKICDSASILLDKIMHQSCVLLNSDVITSTTTILELDLAKDRVYWVIQLGALRNSKKVFEIVDKLKMHNYLVYISPREPKSGELVRIFVGPSYVKKDLECLLDDLYSLSGLFGKIRQLPNIHN